MYPIYQTEGIVLESVEWGEAGKYFFVFTRDFGLIRIKASGIRKLTSKLRYHLSDFSLLDLELIRGKESFRVVRAERKKVFLCHLPVVINVAKLLRRLCPEEEVNLKIFETLSAGFALLTTPGVPGTPGVVVEAVIVLRILAALGYLGDPAFSLYADSSFDSDLIKKVGDDLRKVIPAINVAIRESQL